MESLEIVRVEQGRSGERFERGERAAELGVDRGRERTRDLDAGALRLLPLLVHQGEQADAGDERERQKSRRGEVQQPGAERDAAPRLHWRACLARKALISSTRSCGSPGTGCV